MDREEYELMTSNNRWAMGIECAYSAIFAVVVIGFLVWFFLQVESGAVDLGPPLSTAEKAFLAPLFLIAIAGIVFLGWSIIGSIRDEYRNG